MNTTDYSREHVIATTPSGHLITVPPAIITEKCSFIGRTGSGKTYGATKLAELMLAMGAQIIAIDPIGVWAGLRMGGNFQVYIFGGLRGDYPLEPTAGALMADLLVDRGVSAVLDVSHFETDAEKARFAAAFAERFFFRKKSSPSPVHLFIEECQEFVPQQVQAGEERMLHQFQRILKLGRVLGIGASLISQRPQEVNKKALNQTGTMFVFQLTGPQEKKAIHNWIVDNDTTMTAAELRALLPRLEVGSPYLWSPGFLKYQGQVRIAAKITADVSVTPKLGQAAKAKPLTPIDGDQLRADMVATIERAKENDPAELRKLVAELRRENEKLRKTPAAEPQVKYVERPVLDRGAVLVIDGCVADSRNRLNEIEGLLRAAVKKCDSFASSSNELARVGGDNPADSRRAPLQIAERSGSARSANHEPSPKRPVAAAGSTLPEGERKVLIVCAQNLSGATPEQLTVMTGYKRSSRDTYLQRLGAKGMIQKSGGFIKATDAGRAALGNYCELPTGLELQRHWLAELPEGESRILALLIEHHPDPVSREWISSQTNYSRSSRDTYLQRLGARRLCESINRGQVIASANLFD